MKNKIKQLKDEIVELEKELEELEDYYIDKPELDRESGVLLDLAYDEILEKQQELEKMLVLENNEKLAVLFNSITK